jgi:hypothetical protein
MRRSTREAVQGRQLKVQELAIPFTIAGHATPASKTLTSDEPSVLFIQTEGKTQITAAAGALDAGEATPTFSATATDSTGVINLLVKVGEQITKVVSAEVQDRAAGVAQICYIDTNPLSANGDKICLDADLSAALTSGTANMVLIVKYITTN